ncbi:hypothetical protein V1509DRAFT_667689 [Lipomyces kononenkoae]
MKRFDKVTQVALHHGEGSDGEDDEQLQLVEIPLDQSEIENALKRLNFCPEADKSLKYTTRPGGSERSQRRFRAKFRNVESLKPLTAFNFTRTAAANDNLSDEDQKRMERESEPCETADKDNLHLNAYGDTAAISEECYESADHALETSVDLPALVQRIESRLVNKTTMPREEALQLTVLKHYFMDRLRGKGRMRASIDAAFYSFDKGVYMARVIRGWAKVYELTESLPPLSQRGKNTKRKSALADEDVPASERTVCHKAKGILRTGCAS